MSDLAPDDLLQHTALSEPRNSEPSRGMRGGIKDVLGHPITQSGLFQRQPVLTLEKEAAVPSLLFRGECSQSLIQFTTQHHVPPTCGGFYAAGLFATETAVANRYRSSQGIPGSLLLIVAVDPHSLSLADSESRPTQKSVDRSFLLSLSFKCAARGDILRLHTICLDKPLTAVVEWYQSCLNPKTVAAIV